MDAGQFAVLARYGRWANERLYRCCATLGQAELAKPKASFFGSIIATLNHILLVDRLWLGRLQGQPARGIVSLDQILHPDFAGLEAERRALDDHILVWCEGLSGSLDRPVRYRSMAGDEHEGVLSWALMHMFNHATHHRGQVHDMLSASAVEAPALDLIYFLRESRLG